MLAGVSVLVSTASVTVLNVLPPVPGWVVVPSSLQSSAMMYQAPLHQPASPYRSPLAQTAEVVQL